jgi:endonuclease IV
VLCETPNLEEDAVLMQTTYLRAFQAAGRRAA